jgi:hypothetical protein
MRARARPGDARSGTSERRVILGAVRMVAGCDIRRRWRGITVLVLLVGVVGAAVLATVAGSRRSESALGRFNAYSRSGDLELTVGNPTPLQLRTFAGVTGVRAFAPLRAGAMVVPRAPQLQAIASAVDNRFGTVVDRARVVAGRAAAPSAADEITIGEALAATLHIGIGGHLDAQSYTPQQVATFEKGLDAGPAAGPRPQLRVVGIVRRPLDLGDRGAAGGVLVLTPAFTRQYASSIGTFGGTILRVRTVHGAADVPQVAAAARRIFRQSGPFGVQDLSIESAGARNAIGVLTAALWVFAGVAAMAGTVSIAITMSREISLTAVDQETQRALGLTRMQRIAVNGGRMLPVAVGGSLVAVLGAAAASALFPIGVARRAEPSVGRHLDWTVLGLGSAVIAAGILLIAFLAALRVTAEQVLVEPAQRRRPSTVVDAAARAGLSPVATIGVRMALEPGSGPTAVPVRSAFVGAVFGVVGLVAVFMFASSLDHLVTTPRLYGWTWDFAAVVDEVKIIRPGTALVRQTGLAAVAALATDNAQLDGRPVIVWAVSSLRDRISPEIVAGRLPSGSDEIALGAASLHSLGKRLGGVVRGEGPNGSHDYRIVGRVVFPKLNSPQPLANGATLTDAGLARMMGPDDSNASWYVLARLAPGADRDAVERQVSSLASVERPFGPSVPVEVGRLRQVGWLPASLAALLSVLALLAVGHSLVTGVRRRRRDLAVLKTLGFDRRQVRATVASQATTIATIGLVVGIPAGLVVGNLVWRRVADGLGISPTGVVPILALLVAVPTVLALVNLTAFLPARAAARIRPAVALRSE